MKLIYGTSLTAQQVSDINLIAGKCDILFDTARLLYCRGVDTVDKARAFLSPGKVGFNNPFLLSGVYQQLIDLPPQRILMKMF